MPISLRLSRMSVDFATAYHERDGFGPPEAQAAGMCIGDFGKIADCGVDRVGSAFRQFERAVRCRETVVFGTFALCATSCKFAISPRSSPVNRFSKSVYKIAGPSRFDL